MLDLVNPYNAIIVGFTGAGKTTDVKKLIAHANLPLFAFDVNGDFGQYPPPQKDDFLKEAVKKKNTFLLFEEATIFFRNTMQVEEILRLMTLKRHTGNKTAFLFHSLRAVPLDIMDYYDFIILKKTGDRATLIKTKYKDDPHILKAFEKVNADPNPYASIIIPNKTGIPQKKSEHAK